MSDRDDTRDTRDNTRECGSMFDPRAERADTHTRGAPTGSSSDRPRENTHTRGAPTGPSSDRPRENTHARGAPTILDLGPNLVRRQ